MRGSESEDLVHDVHFKYNILCMQKTLSTKINIS